MAIKLPRLRREVPIVESNNVPTSTFQQWLDIAFKQIESSVSRIELALAGAGIALDTADRVLPAGGTTDQVLAKVDGTDYNVEWVDAAAGSSDPWTYVKLASNNTVSTTAFANVTGMSFTAAANTTYIVNVMGAYQTAATTTGVGLALDIPSGSVVGQVVANTSATAATSLEQIADATTTGVTTGVRAANTNTPISARFVVAVGATGGTVQLLQRSEVAASNTVLQANLTVMGYRAV
jgi:hypothetical protein